MKKINIRKRDGTVVGDRRNSERKTISAPIKAKFKISYEAEVMDVSPDGISLKFHPLQSSDFNAGKKISMDIDMNGRLVNIEGEVRRLDEKFGHFVLGVKYDRDEVTIFEIKKPSEKK